MSDVMNGADLLCRELERAGVRCVFGLPGTQTVGMYDSLRRSGLRAVVPSHELAAAFMASGYARATGRPAILLTIPGPGFAYALAGIAEARLDATPVVHITLRPAVGPTGAPAFQAIDQAEIVRPLVKAVLQVGDVRELVAATREALRLAAAPDPGPVYLEFTEAVLRDPVGQAGEDSSALEPPPKQAPFVGAPPGANSVVGHDSNTARELALVVEAVLAARRPVLFVASDCSESAALLGSVCEGGRVPVCVPPPYRGVLPEDHPWSLCFDDQRTVVERLNAVLAQSDCIVVLGSRLGHVSTAGFRTELPVARVVCVTASGESLPHGYSARLLARARPAALLESLATRRDQFESEWTSDELRASQELFLQSPPSDLPEPQIDGLAAPQWFAELRSELPRDVVVVTDSGLHQLLVRRHCNVLAPSGLMFPSDLQCMGFGLPAALGAKLAVPERPVVAIVGDGGLVMSGMDLLTAARDGIPVVVVVFNDGKLNLIRLQQLREFGRSHGVELEGPDFASLAAAMGVRYRQIKGDIRAAMREALALGAPVLLDVHVGDSFSVHRLRAASIARETVRGALGPTLVSWIKGRLR